MGNVFIDQPEFLGEDPRVSWPKSSGYSSDPEFVYERHALLLPADLLKGKRVLDLGSCNAATGAWVLSNGAAYYRGVELQAKVPSSFCLQLIASK